MRIIIIIVEVAAGGGAFGLVLLLFFGILFSDAGSGEPGVINTITNRAPCFPSIDAFNNAKRIAAEADRNGAK